MNRHTVLQSSGLVAVGVTLAAIFLATLFSPAFSWTGNALSNLGVMDTTAGTFLTVILFNGGLIVGGTVGVVFAVVLAHSVPMPEGRAVGALFGLAMLLLAAIGVFPQDVSLHFPVAVGFYLLLSLALWADGLVALRYGWRQRALAGLGLGSLNLLGWVGWGVTGPLRRDGLAVPEIIGALALSAWVVWVSVVMFRGRWTGPSNT